MCFDSVHVLNADVVETSQHIDEVISIAAQQRVDDEEKRAVRAAAVILHPRAGSDVRHIEIVSDVDEFKLKLEAAKIYLDFALGAVGGLEGAVYVDGDFHGHAPGTSGNRHIHLSGVAVQVQSSSQGVLENGGGVRPRRRHRCWHRRRSRGRLRSGSRRRGCRWRGRRCRDRRLSGWNGTRSWLISAWVAARDGEHHQCD